MEVSADPGAARHDLEDIVAEVPRVTGQKPDSREFGHLVVDPSQESGESRDLRIIDRLVPERLQPRPDLRRFAAIDGQCDAVVVSVVIHRLTEQGHLDDPGGGEPSALLDDGFRRTMDFGASGVGDHAVGAELVAPPGDPDVGAPGRTGRLVGVERTSEIERFEVVLGRGKGRRPAAGVAGEGHASRLGRLIIGGRRCSRHVVDQHRQLVEFTRTAQEVDLWIPPQHVDAIPLRHASKDAEDEILARLLSLPDDAEPAVGLALRVLADAAGIEKEDLGVVGLGRESISDRRQMSPHQLAVELVHLTSEGLEVYGLHGWIPGARATAWGRESYQRGRGIRSRSVRAIDSRPPRRLSSIRAVETIVANEPQGDADELHDRRDPGIGGNRGLSRRDRGRVHDHLPQEGLDVVRIGRSLFHSTSPQGR